MTETTLGQRIAERRKMLSLSQEAFGEKMGVSRQAAFKWESDASIPEVDKLINMSRLFGVSVGWLLGEEEPGQPTDEDPEVLTEQILLTFQPPQPEPEPAKQEVPMSTPEPEEPKKQAGKSWPTVVLAVAVSISLVLSVFSYWTFNRKLQQAEEQNATLLEQLAAQSTQITDLEDLCITLNQRIDKVDQDRIRDRIAVNLLQADLQELIDALGTGTMLTPPTDPLPTYEDLESWSLTAETGPDTSSVNLHFSATASVDIVSAELKIFPGDPGHVVSNSISTVCSVSGRDISKEFTIPAGEEYQYELCLRLANNQYRYFFLEGHGLTNLAALSQPTLRTTPKSVYLFRDKLYFSQGWFNIYVAVPYLAPKDAQCRWDDLKISYYQNDQLVREYPLDSYFTSLARNEASLSFEMPTKNYEMIDFVENDIHELRLEGTLTIEGTENEFSLPLRRWQIRQAEFVDMME